jgi:endonuclease/exonuclease/phosphatase family metal-dependent hydrolase
MTTLRIATFNVENLFARWKFAKGADPAAANKRGWTVDETMFEELGVDAKTLTGMAVREVKADVLAFQEVENVDTLKHFRSQFLGGRSAYPYVAGIDGNDPRLIDVAVLSKLPIVHVRSFQHLMDPKSPTSTLFSRDCLEVDVEVDAGVTLTLFVNHFKSMLGGRKATSARRKMQAGKVMEIVKDRFGSKPGKENFIVLGDFNDYLEKDKQGSTGIAELVNWDQVENVVARRPAKERWTHYYASGKDYKQLDYMLLSKSLAAASAGEPEIMRKGTPLRATAYSGERFPGVGDDNPKASDHCPVVMDVSVGS